MRPCLKPRRTPFNSGDSLRVVMPQRCHDPGQGDRQVRRSGLCHATRREPPQTGHQDGPPEAARSTTPACAVPGMAGRSLRSEGQAGDMTMSAGNPASAADRQSTTSSSVTAHFRSRRRASPSRSPKGRSSAVLGPNGAGKSTPHPHDDHADAGHQREARSLPAMTSSTRTRCGQANHRRDSPGAYQRHRSYGRRKSLSIYAKLCEVPQSRARSAISTTCCRQSI